MFLSKKKLVFDFIKNITHLTLRTKKLGYEFSKEEIEMKET